MPDLHRERMTAPPAWWIGAGCFALAIGWIVLVATTWTIAVAAAAITAAVVLALVAKAGDVTIEASSAGLRVGDAFLDAPHVGRVEVLDHTTYRRRLGPEANAAAYLVTKPFLDRGVQIEVSDPDDATPYWLISSRHPQALADALRGHVKGPA